MDCELVRPLLDCYIDNELTAEAEQDVEVHITGCAACRELVGELVAQAAEIREAVEERLPDLDDDYWNWLQAQVVARSGGQPAPSHIEEGGPGVSRRPVLARALAAAAALLALGVPAILFGVRHLEERELEELTAAVEAAPAAPRPFVPQRPDKESSRARRRIVVPLDALVVAKRLAAGWGRRSLADRVRGIEDLFDSLFPAEAFGLARLVRSGSCEEVLLDYFLGWSFEEGEAFLLGKPPHAAWSALRDEQVPARFAVRFFASLPAATGRRPLLDLHEQSAAPGEALVALARLRGLGAFPWVRRALAGGNHPQQTIRALRIMGPAAFAPLANAASAATGEERNRLLWGLGARRDPRAVPLLVSWARLAATRRAALLALGDLSHPDALDRLLRALASTVEAPIARRAIRLWGSGATEHLIRIARQGPLSRRRLASEGIGCSGGPDALPFLVASARRRQLAAAALRGLGYLGDPRALDLLEEAAGDPSLERIALESAARIRGERALALVVSRLASKRQALLALRLLASWPGPRAAHFLAQAARRGTHRLQALGSLAGRPGGPLQLIDMLGEPRLRPTVRYLLARLAGKDLGPRPGPWRAWHALMTRTTNLKRQRSRRR